MPYSKASPGYPPPRVPRHITLLVTVTFLLQIVEMVRLAHGQ